MASHLGYPVAKLKEHVPSTELIRWGVFLQEQEKRHSKLDHYLAQIAFEVYRLNFVLGGTPTKKMEDFLLQFEFRQRGELPISTTQETPSEQEESKEPIMEERKEKPTINGLTPAQMSEMSWTSFLAPMRAKIRERQQKAVEKTQTKPNPNGTRTTTVQSHFAKRATHVKPKGEGKT